MEVEREGQPVGKALVEGGGEALAIQNQRQITVEICSRRGIEDHPVLAGIATEGPDVQGPAADADSAANDGDREQGSPRETCGLGVASAGCAVDDNRRSARSAPPAGPLPR